MVFEIILRLWDSLKYLWRLMSVQKQNFYREVSPMARVYNQMEMVIFCVGITFGKTCFILIPRVTILHGDILLLLWVLNIPLVMMTASCFAEMAALVPAVGAHYHYCYSTICEIVGFLVGWNLLLAYSALAIERSSDMSRFIDKILLNDWILKNMKFMETKNLLFFCVKGYVDLISPLIIILMACLAAWAVKVTKTIFNVLAGFNLLVIIILVLTFGSRLDFHLFEIENTPDKQKLYDIFATVQLAMIGYESLGVLGEEAKNPTETIPKSIIISVKFLVSLYVVLTFVISFGAGSEIDYEIDPYNPISSLLQQIGFGRLSWLTNIGTVTALWCSAYGHVFVLIRMMYAMSRDGLIFKMFSKVDRYTKTPALPATIFGILIGIIVTFIKVGKGLSFSSLIFGKIMTATCLLITRYRLEKKRKTSAIKKDPGDRWLIMNCPRSQTEPTEITHGISMLLIYCTVISAMASLFSIIIIHIMKHENYDISIKVLGYFSIVSCIIFVLLLKNQPSNSRTYLSYNAGGVPITPLLSIMADLFSALIVCRSNWLWGLAWSLIGIVFYFIYSIHHSVERRIMYSDGTRWNPLENSRNFAYHSSHKFVPDNQ